MNEIETLQPKPFRDIDAVLYAPRDAEDAVPNPFAIPPEWLAAWQAEADDRAVMAVAAAQAQETAALKAASAASAANVKPDGILASLSEVIPKFFQKLDVPAKKSSGPEDWLKSAQDAVTSVIGGAEQQVQSALSSSAQQVGHGAATGASQGFLQTLETGLPSLISKAQEALDPAVKQIVTGAVAAAKPGVEELAHSAGKHATAGAQEQLHEGGTGLKIDTTTWLVGGVAVLGAIGLGAWLLSPSDRRFGATSTEELQKMLDSASWVRPSRGPTVKWLEAPKSEHFVSKTRDAKSKDNLLAVDGDSGFGTGIAVIGGASALAVLIGYLAKGKLAPTARVSGARRLPVTSRTAARGRQGVKRAESTAHRLITRTRSRTRSACRKSISTSMRTRFSDRTLPRKTETTTLPDTRSDARLVWTTATRHAATKAAPCM